MPEDLHLNGQARPALVRSGRGPQRARNRPGIVTATADGDTMYRRALSQPGQTVNLSSLSLPCPFTDPHGASLPEDFHLNGQARPVLARSDRELSHPYKKAPLHTQGGIKSFIQNPII